jgi:hypothetical protein
MPNKAQSPRSNLKLFMFYVGGDCANSNIELHDVRFVVGPTAKSCYDDLRHQWWGEKSSLHIDCWLEVTQVDGYNVTLSSVSSGAAHNLYFLNLGGYEDNSLEEMHRNVLFVEESSRHAIRRAIGSVKHWRVPHKDALLRVEKAISISAGLKEQGVYVHLTKALEKCLPKYNIGYIRLGKRS